MDFIQDVIVAVYCIIFLWADSVINVDIFTLLKDCPKRKSVKEGVSQFSNKDS